MAGYLGSEAAFVSVAIADIEGDLTVGVDATVEGDLTVGGGLTSRGIDDNATSIAMTLDSSGNVLVGKTSNDNGATRGVEVEATGQLNVCNDDALVSRFNRLTSDGDIVALRKDGTAVGSIGSEGGDSLYIESGTTSGAGIHLHPTAGNINPSRNGSKVDNAIDLGRSSHRFKDLYLSGGVYLGGAAEANKLYDYEEGTWTPNIVGEVTNSNGTYTKVGSLVTAYFYINLPNIGFSQDPALIDGLPFTANNISAAQSGKSAGFIAFNTDGKAASLLFETGSNRVGFRSDPGGTALDRGTVAGNTYYGTLIYNTDS